VVKLKDFSGTLVLYIYIQVEFLEKSNICRRISVSLQMILDATLGW